MGNAEIRKTTKPSLYILLISGFKKLLEVQRLANFILPIKK